MFNAHKHALLSLYFFLSLAQTILGQQIPSPFPHICAEDPSLRDRYSKHYPQPNGLTDAIIHHDPIHYMDSTGRWQDIDTRLVPSERAGFAWENTTNSFQCFYPPRLSDTAGITLLAGQHELQIGIGPRLEAFDARGRRICLLEQVRTGEVTVLRNTVSYNAFDIGIYEFEMHPGRVKNNLVLEALPLNLPAEISFLALTETITLPRGWSLAAAGKHIRENTLCHTGIAITDAEGTAVLYIPRPEVYEQIRVSDDPPLHHEGQCIYRIAPLGGDRYELSTLVPIHWLTTTGRRWPVVIDPSVTAPGGWGGTMTSGQNLNEWNPTFYVFVSDDYFGTEHRGFVQWDVSSIPDSSMIYNTELRAFLNASNNGLVSDSIFVNNVTEGLAPYFIYSDSAFIDLGNGPYLTFTCSLSNSHYGYYDLGNAADADLHNSLAGDAFQLGFSMNPTAATSWKRFTSDSSMLRITYFECSGGQVSAVINGTDLTCNGDSSGSITAVASGGGSAYTYVWSGPGGYLDTVQNPTGLAAGTYTVTVYSGSYCPGVDSLVITEPGPVTIVLDTLSLYAGGHNVSCSNASDGLLSVSTSDTGTYVYAWSGPGGFGTTGPSITGLAAGTYYLTATAGGTGCVVSDSFTLSAPDTLNAVIQNQADAYCPYDSNGTALGTATGGTPPYTCLWNTGSTGWQATGLKAMTNYFFTVTDLNGCTDTASVFIGAQHGMPAVDLGPDTGFCIGSVIVLDAGSEASLYQWSNGHAGRLLAVSALDTYAVTVTSAAGCVNADTVVLDTIYPLPTPELGPDTIVTGSSCTLDAGSYPACLWSTGETTQAITVTANGHYTVTVTNDHGCQDSDGINVTLWPAGITTADPGPPCVLHPNPVHNFLYISSPYVPDPFLEISILDALGQCVQKCKTKGGSSLYLTLDTRHLPAGYYFLRICGNTTRWHQKFIVEK